MNVKLRESMDDGKIKKGEKQFIYPSFPFLKRVQDMDEKKQKSTDRT
ncbi:MAG TPA: hypothetical protein VFJ67_05675 [Thermodesulfobacteriota bacterium]|nr:hypothetical protein [Thermodesulfobacteriota bacterium]